jgi:hypothetical protein
MYGVLGDWPGDPFVSKVGESEWVEDAIGVDLVMGGGRDLETFAGVLLGWGNSVRSCELR